jgi:hypothetical protein
MARSSNGNAFFTNFATYDASFAAKVRLALANSWRKDTHPIKLLRELRRARLLTAGQGGPGRVRTTTVTHITTMASTTDPRPAVQLLTR